MANTRYVNEKSKITYFSLGMNIILVTLKLAVSFITGSTAVLSEAIHSGSDLLTSLIAFFSVKESAKPPDRDHPYGHGKYENIASLFEGIIIFASGLYIIFRASKQLVAGVEISSLDLGMGTMLFAAIVNYFVSSLLIKKGRELESPAIEADGWHSRTDVFTAAGVMISLAIVRFTGIKIIDPIISLLVAGVILWLAAKILGESMNYLVDSRLPIEEEKKILEVIKIHSSQYLEFHKMRSRKKGGEREIDLHLVLPDYTLLKKAHDLSDHLEEEIGKIFPNIRVLIHSESCEKGKNLEYDCPDCREYKKCRESGYVEEEHDATIHRGGY